MVLGHIFLKFRWNTKKTFEMAFHILHQSRSISRNLKKKNHKVATEQFCLKHVPIQKLISLLLQWNLIFYQRIFTATRQLVLFGLEFSLIEWKQIVLSYSIQICTDKAKCNLSRVVAFRNAATIHHGVSCNWIVHSNWYLYFSNSSSSILCWPEPK